MGRERESQGEKGKSRGRGKGRLTPTSDRHDGREGVHNKREGGPEEEDDVGQEACAAEVEGAVGDLGAAFEEEAAVGLGC